MAIVGFGFTKMLIQRKSEVKGKVNINNNVSIQDVEETDLSLGTAKQKGLKIFFEFKSEYQPDIAEILFEGHVLDVEDPKELAEITKGWKKDKKLPKTIMEPVVNSVLMKCNIQALIMSKELNLPPPIPLPKVGGKKQ
ncbi:hypothetical protein GF345_04845 [Candidatus Woesearchaeota archaeon]|nr:hypothetical protein [Candidatus Woesearchaeota archaeon]